mgnify:FL=1
MNGGLLRPMNGSLLKITLGRSLVGWYEGEEKGYSSRLARATLPSLWVQKSPPEHPHGALGRTLFVFALVLSKHLTIVLVDLPTSLFGGLEGLGGHTLQDLFILLLAELRDEDIDIDQEVALTIAINRRQTLTT